MKMLEKDHEIPLVARKMTTLEPSYLSCCRKRWAGHFYWGLTWTDRFELTLIQFVNAVELLIRTSLTIAIGTGIAMRDSKFASIHCNNDFELSKDWAKYLMQRMDLVKRRESTKAKVGVADFEKIKKGFLLDVHNVMEMDKILPDLVINFDQTAVHYVPVDNWTMAKEGSKRVEIIGKDDKRQITAVLGGR